MVKNLFLGIVACYGICGANWMDGVTNQDKLFVRVTEDEYIASRNKMRSIIPYYIESLPFSNIEGNMGSFLCDYDVINSKGDKYELWNDVLIMMSPEISYLLKNKQSNYPSGSAIFTVCSSNASEFIVDFCNSEFCTEKSKSIMQDYFSCVINFIENYNGGTLTETDEIVKLIQAITNRNDKGTPLLTKEDYQLFDKLYNILSYDYGY